MKTCPFCDSESVQLARPCGDMNYRTMACWTCGAQGPLVNRWEHSKETDAEDRAIVEWDKRAQQVAGVTK